MVNIALEARTAEVPEQILNTHMVMCQTLHHLRLRALRALILPTSGFWHHTWAMTPSSAALGITSIIVFKLSHVLPLSIA